MRFKESIPCLTAGQIEVKEKAHGFGFCFKRSFGTWKQRERAIIYEVKSQAMQL
jgi:hypothetical protein